MTDTAIADRREQLLIALITIAGIVPRLWAFGRVGLSHFDEGVYAISGLWALDPGGLAALDPGVIPYAPPGFPVLVGLAYALLGVSDSVAILPSEALGIALIPLAGWLGRRTFGRGAGVAAAALTAFSLPAIAFSRKALTDVPFLFVWVFAIGAGGRFLERPGVGRSLALGAAVALAQYFKYNGWLAGAVTIAAALAGTWVDPVARRAGEVARTFGFGLVAAAFAVALYWPWFAFVETHGGYAALLRHQRGYFGGPSHWGGHWGSQLAQAHALSGAPWFPTLAWAVAWSSARWVVGARQSVWSDRRFWFGLLAGSVALALFPNLAWWIGLAALPSLVRAKDPPRRMLGVWWIALSGLTPLYHPYARIWLPLHAAGWLVLAGVARGLDADVPAPSSGGAVPRDLVRRYGLLTGCVVAGVVQAVAAHAHPLPARWFLDPAPSLRDGAVALAGADGTRAERPALLVLGRRPLAYYFHLLGRQVRLAEGTASLTRGAPPDVRAIVDDAVVKQEGDVAQLIGRIERFWAPEARFTDLLDPVTLLDVDPTAAVRTEPDRRVTVWRLTPRGPGAAPPQR